MAARNRRMSTYTPPPADSKSHSMYLSVLDLMDLFGEHINHDNLDTPSETRKANRRMVNALAKARVEEGGPVIVIDAIGLVGPVENGKTGKRIGQRVTRTRVEVITLAEYFALRHKVNMDAALAEYPDFNGDDEWWLETHGIAARTPRTVRKTIEHEDGHVYDAEVTTYES